MSQNVDDRKMKAFIDALDSELEDLDQETLERLQQARMAAINVAENEERSGISPWSLGALCATAASILLVVLVYLPLSPSPERDDTLTSTELEWLLQGDDLELVSEELAFYDWVASELGTRLQDS